MLHNVTPVAGGVTDAEEDRFVGRFGKGEGFFPPWIPIDGVVGVLEEIWACFVRMVIYFYG